jgi:hypothetical protein
MSTLIDVMVSFAQLIDAVRENPAIRDSEEAGAVLSAACHFYETASPDDRQQLRRLLPSEIHEQLVWRFVPRLVASFTETGNTATLHLALVALSLDDNRWDYRDTFVHLGTLYRTALSFQLDPMHYFREVAAISNPTDSMSGRGHHEKWRDSLPMQAFLTWFEDSAFFNADVKPYL